MISYIQALCAMRRHANLFEAPSPVLGPLFGRSWSQIEVFGVAPDPTAVATLGVLLLGSGRVRWELMALPLLWCAVSGATLLSMDAPAAGIPIGAAVLVVWLAAWQTLALRRKKSRKDTR